MSTVRDPAFWKRFSTAVHLQEVQSMEIQSSASSSSSSRPGKRPPLDREDSWLAREQRKKKRQTILCWIYFLGFLCFAAAIAIVVVVLMRDGVFARLGKEIDGGK